MRAGGLPVVVSFCKIESGGSVRDRLAGVILLHFLAHCADTVGRFGSADLELTALLTSLVARVSSPYAELRLGVETDVAALAAATLAQVTSRAGAWLACSCCVECRSL